jgi:hypothetical protein
MGKVGSPDVGFLTIDGFDLLPAKVQTFTYAITNLLEKTDGLGDKWDEHTPTGLRRCTVTQGGAYYETAANGMHDAFKANPTAYRKLAFAIAGAGAGAPLVVADGTLSTSYEVLARNGNLTKANVQYQISGSVTTGALVDPPVAHTADWIGATGDYALDPSNPALTVTGISVAAAAVVTTATPHALVVGSLVLLSGTNSTPALTGPYAATVLTPTTFSVPITTTVAGTTGTVVRVNSPAGGSALQDVSAYSGFTGVQGKIRHSTDGSTWVDLVVFAPVTAAPNSQRVTVPGLIHRYVRFEGDVTGTGSVRLLAGLTRNR